MSCLFWLRSGTGCFKVRAGTEAGSVMSEAEEQGDRGNAGGQGRMPPTLWTLVLTARDIQSPDAHTALAKLCEIYWLPLYAFVRRHGYNHHEAEDLTQGFFERLFKRTWLEGVGKEKGRFRTFLLCSLSNFLINDREKQMSLKRGGAVQEFVSWDAEHAESRLSEMSGSQMDAAMEFERLWACSLVERALAILKNEY